MKILSGTLQRLSPHLRNALNRAGWYASRRDSFERVDNLWAQLRPFEIEEELVRVGSRGDGGYILPDDFQNLSAVFSPGVADNADFELAFANMGIPCFLLDPTVPQAPVRHDLISFERLWLAPESIPQVSITLDEWVETRAPQGDCILQMDIEGSEYETLLSSKKETLERFRYVLIEFHNFTSIFSREGNRLIGATMRKILQTHVPIHAHQNNCCLPLKIGGRVMPDVLEVTFAHREQVRLTGEFATIPHALDSPNTSKPDWSLSWKTTKESFDV